MRIVSDTGPIIGLAKIGMVDLLKALASEVLIPFFQFNLQRLPPRFLFGSVRCNIFCEMNI